MGNDIVQRAEIGQSIRPQGAAVLAYARESLESQGRALDMLSGRLGEDFVRALELLIGCAGRVVVSGIGKSGLIGRKISATLACSGTPSFFLHPAEASHGDLGMVTSKDVLILISNSGETEEVIRFLPHFQGLGLPIIAIVGRPDSTLGRAAQAVLDISVERETCPHNLVPTTSALATLAMGDALAVAAMRVRNFSPDDFARFHPGGALGKRLNSLVRDAMRTRDLPLVRPDTSMQEALLAMTRGRCGLVVATDAARAPLGIITDGDLRRALQRDPKLLTEKVADVMTASPVTIREDASLYDAEQRMHRLRIKALVVVDAEQHMVGLLEIFDDRAVDD